MADLLAGRRGIVEVGRRMWLRGLVAANDGNISIRLPGDRVVSTATGVSKGFLSEADLVVTDLEGRLIEGRARPTSELGMHLEIYRARPEIHAVVHAHPPAATAFAASGLDLSDCFLSETAIFLGGVPTAPYATPGTDEVALSIRGLVPHTDVLLLAHHGAVTMGPDLESAYFKMETLEHTAKVALYARQLGGPKSLPRAELDRLEDSRERYGLDLRALSCRAPSAAGPSTTPGAGPAAASAAARDATPSAGPSTTPGAAPSSMDGREERALVERAVEAVLRRLQQQR